MNQPGKVSLNIKYALLQGFYWMTYGSIVSYASAYLLGIGFDNGAIGNILALGSIIAAVVLSPMAAYADKSETLTLSQIAMIFTAGITVLSVVLFLFKGNHTVAAISYLLFLTAIMLLQPLANSVGMFYVNHGYPLNFGVTRGTGSISYAIACGILGFSIDTFGIKAIPAFIFILSFGFVVILALNNTSHKLPYTEDAKKTQKKAKPLSFMAFAKKYKMFMVLLLGVILIFIHHTVLNSFQYQIMENVSGSSTDVGITLFISATSELPTMFGFAWLLKKWRSNTLLRVSVLGFTIKGIAFAMASSVNMVHLAQTIQVVGYALFTPVMVYYVNELVSEEDAVKGQALFTTAITIGSVLGNFLGGQMINRFGVSYALTVGYILTGAGAAIVLLTAQNSRSESLSPGK